MRYCSLPFLFSFSFTLLFGSKLVSLPTIESPRREIQEVSVKFLADPFPHSRFNSECANALGRTHRKLTEVELRLDGIEHQEGKFGEIQADESGFDLWKAVEKFRPEAGSSILVQFAVISESNRSIVLGLGCADEAFLSLNGRWVFGTVGSREYTRTENLVELNLIRGENNITLVFRKAHIWKNIPDLHDDDQWRMGVELYVSERSAWNSFRSRNFNLLDTPVVSKADNLRVQSVMPFCTDATFSDVTGRVLSHGSINKSGSIAWSEQFPPGPLLGFLRIGNSDVESVLVTGTYSVDDTCTYLRALATCSPATSAWRLRLDHLLSTAFKRSRDYWWARKLVVALAKSIADDHIPAVNALLQQCRPCNINFSEFRSNIDGSTQFYRSFNLRRSDGAPRAIIVVLPPVNTPVRPYLQSAEVAIQRDSENVAALAEEWNLGVVWPGLVDVDCGGDLSQFELKECLSHVASEFNIRDPQYYLLGTCSSAVIAIGFAERFKVAGIALQSPAVHRNLFRWFVGLDVDDVPYPDSVGGQESTEDRIDSLSEIPVFLVYNTDIPGHGDYFSSKALCNRLVELGGDLTQCWPERQTQFLWGERARMQLNPIFKWVFEKSCSPTSSSPVSHSKPPSQPFITIKSLLLRGFFVQKPMDPVLASWFDRWGDLWCKFRGSRWKTAASSTDGTIVAGRVLNLPDLDSIQKGGFFPGQAQMEQLEEKTTFRPTDVVFGFRIVTRQGIETVEVFRSVSAVSLPNIELLVDGCCKAALWKFVGGEWQLVNCWL